MQPPSEPSSTESTVYNFKKGARSLSKKNLIIDMLEDDKGRNHESVFPSNDDLV